MDTVQTGAPHHDVYDPLGTFQVCLAFCTDVVVSQFPSIRSRNQFDCHHAHAVCELSQRGIVGIRVAVLVYAMGQ